MYCWIVLDYTGQDQASSDTASSAMSGQVRERRSASRAWPLYSKDTSAVDVHSPPPRSALLCSSTPIPAPKTITPARIRRPPASCLSSFPPVTPPHPVRGRSRLKLTRRHDEGDTRGTGTTGRGKHVEQLAVAPDLRVSTCGCVVDRLSEAERDNRDIESCVERKRRTSMAWSVCTCQRRSRHPQCRS